MDSMAPTHKSPDTQRMSVSNARMVRIVRGRRNLTIGQEGAN